MADEYDFEAGEWILPGPPEKPDVPIGEVEKLLAECSTIEWDALALRSIE